ncbi:MAG TPA: hydrogenase expression/formation protein HypE [Firmicutes bacterium]|nr:hydrogenase expression/formation protein HypE [Candidatus Fermentithermobacillaceae bacterium]
MPDKIILSHGDGGALTRELFRSTFQKHLGNPFLSEADDSAILPLGTGQEICFTTDSFVIDPLFFPGGDIGKLSVYGTLNDLWVSGAKPLCLSCGFIIEEGLAMATLEKIVRSMADAASSSGVSIVAGDTKVVPRGKGDKVYINTSGIGILQPERRMDRKAYPGDRVLVSGTLAEHGLVIMALRAGLEPGELVSDCGPVGSAVDSLFASGREVHMMRDPTRGGLATVLKEVAEASACNITLYESEIPLKEEARQLLDLLGLDPLYLPCEGRVVAFAAPGPLPDGWTDIGEVGSGDGTVLLKTRYGGHRRLGFLEGMPLPRIC